MTPRASGRKSRSPSRGRSGRWWRTGPVLFATVLHCQFGISHQVAVTTGVAAHRPDTMSRSLVSVGAYGRGVCLPGLGTSGSQKD